MWKLARKHTVLLLLLLDVRTNLKDETETKKDFSRFELHFLRTEINDHFIKKPPQFVFFSLLKDGYKIYINI